MNNHAKLGLLLPAALNPATAAALGIGLVAVGIYRLLMDDEDQTCDDKEPADLASPDIQGVEVALSAADLSDDKPIAKPLNDTAATGEITLKPIPTASTEPDQSEMIRKAMSALGKRSAAARAKKLQSQKVA